MSETFGLSYAMFVGYYAMLLMDDTITSEALCHVCLLVYKKRLVD